MFKFDFLTHLKLESSLWLKPTGQLTWDIFYQSASKLLVD